MVKRGRKPVADATNAKLIKEETIKEEAVPYYGQGEATTTNGVKEEPANVNFDEINDKVIDAATTQNLHEPEKPNNENEEILSSPEEIKERLDSLSKVRPFTLLRTIAILSRRMHPKYEVTHSEIIENDETINVVSVELHFIDHVVKINNVKSSNSKMDLSILAESIAADLLLKKLYPEDHELDPKTIESKNNLEVEFSTDNEWYSANSQIFKQHLLKHAAKKIKQVEESSIYTDEEKKAKLIEVELEKEPILEQLTYKELYKFFVNTYFKVLLNICAPNSKYMNRKADIQSEVNFDLKIHKIIDGEEVEIKKDEQRHVGFTERLRVSCYKVTYTLTKNEIELFKIEQILTSSYSEARNRIAYLVLEKLLLTGVIKTVSKDDLTNRFKSVQMRKLRKDQNRKRKTPAKKQLPAKQKAKIDISMQNNFKNGYQIFSQTFPVRSNLF